MYTCKNTCKTQTGARKLSAAPVVFQHSVGMSITLMHILS